MPEQTTERERRQSPSAQISNATVALMREYTGRGPTQARTTINDKHVVVLLRDTMLKAEQSLADRGESQIVLDMRRRFQETMRADLIHIVEGVVGRSVIAFMSDNHLDPDMAVEVFVLEPEEIDLAQDGNHNGAAPASG
jgi:uncharacterized protein YbcI